MIDRLVLSVALGVTGWNGLFPDPPAPPTPPTLKAKAKERSLSQVCSRKNNRKQSDTVKRICREWKEQQRA